MGGHDLPTSKKAIKKIIKIIAEKKPGKNNFYDLGSGRGNVAIAVKKKFPQLLVVGIEKRALQLFFAKLKTFFLKSKIVFQKEDLFKADLRDADIVYAYLWSDIMPSLEEKLQRELKERTLVITNTSYFPNWEPTETYVVWPKKPDFEKLFLYIKKSF